ncbi:unnamed protein product [Meloidogyne enterolobii]|uniref:Uncharacterized protein n=2 Tax=Meloidogyne enterolobii TaxID=390850 RepID=A0ACB1A9B5_MELEN
MLSKIIFIQLFFLTLGIPFNRFPISSVGIERLSSYDLASYSKLLDKLEQNVYFSVRTENNLELRNYQLQKLLIKNGFRDEAEFEHTRQLVKWEENKRNKKFFNYPSGPIRMEKINYDFLI